MENCKETFLFWLGSCQGWRGDRWEFYHLNKWQPTLVFLLGKSHERRSLVGYSPWGLEESGTTEQLHFHFSLSRTGECIRSWRVPGREEPCVLLSMGSHRVGHDWSDLAAAAHIVSLLRSHRNLCDLRQTHIKCILWWKIQLCWV